tara:strand:+ start:4330 stop:5193 length:864 start_codon:yes stop_codon:yes gene_type:complete
MRFKSGLFLGLFGLIVVILGGWYFTLTVCFLIHLALLEFFKIAELSGIRPATKTTLVLCQIILIATHFETQGVLDSQLSLSILPISSAVICGWLILQPVTGKISDIAASVFGLFYLGFLPSHWIRLRSISDINNLFWNNNFEQINIISSDTALIITFSTCLMIVASDIGSYVIGGKFGTHSLTLISPGKTIEGTLGGFLSSILIGILISIVFKWDNGYYLGILFGFLISLFGLIGDLIESMMKRDAGLKDSGDVLPGHGGILDRIDSYIFTPSIIFYLIKFLNNFNF